uniref:Uncharacterized protein n=1 Tax=Pararge aegeria TaxID=116150 RepID=S4P8X1_9NEOP
MGFSRLSIHCRANRLFVARINAPRRRGLHRSTAIECICRYLCAPAHKEVLVCSDIIACVLTQYLALSMCASFPGFQYRGFACVQILKALLTEI